MRGRQARAKQRSVRSLLNASMLPRPGTCCFNRSEARPGQSSFPTGGNVPAPGVASGFVNDGLARRPAGGSSCSSWGFSGASREPFPAFGIRFSSVLHRKRVQALGGSHQPGSLATSGPPQFLTKSRQNRKTNRTSKGRNYCSIKPSVRRSPESPVPAPPKRHSLRRCSRPAHRAPARCHRQGDELRDLRLRP